MAPLKPKLVVVLGPTASGKSELAIKIAKRFNGEIISADSRQVYRGMDIGTGKVTKKEMQGIAHYLLDVASPKRRFTVAQYQKLALRAINKIIKKKKIPILCGGAGFYIQALVDGIIMPELKPDWRLRANLEKKSTQNLFKLLKKLDPRRAKTIEKQNPRRLIRALEIVIKTGKPVPVLKKKTQFNLLMIGITKSPEKLKKLIKKRLLKRLKKGMVAEVKKLRNPPAGGGLSWQRLEDFGLEYRLIARYLRSDPNVASESDLVKKLQKETEHYAKRQMTWFSAHGGSASGGKRPARQSPEGSRPMAGGDKRIHWIKNYKEAEILVKKFIES